jgi:hypothetical protein
MMVFNYIIIRIFLAAFFRRKSFALIFKKIQYIFEAIFHKQIVSICLLSKWLDTNESSTHYELRLRYLQLPTTLSLW